MQLFFCCCSLLLYSGYKIPPPQYSPLTHIESSCVTVCAASAYTLSPPTPESFFKMWTLESCNPSLTKEPSPPPFTWKVTFNWVVRERWAFGTTEIGLCDPCDPRPCLSKNIQQRVNHPTTAARTCTRTHSAGVADYSNTHKLLCVLQLGGAPQDLASQPNALRSPRHVRADVLPSLGLRRGRTFLSFRG